MSTRPLFTPYRMGDLDLPNRIVMAPLTRMRARPDDHVPTVWQAEYYAQRATAGLIVTEGVAISPEGFGWADTPGLWSEEQVRGWSHVTDAVHAAGGRIVVQLWHTGAMSHPDLRGGALPLSASDVNPEQQSVTAAGRVPTVAPRPMTRDAIRRTVADYARAARNAMNAGFDGVQIQANYLYLLLNSSTRRRTADPTSMAVTSRDGPGSFSRSSKPSSTESIPRRSVSRSARCTKQVPSRLTTRPCRWRNTPSVNWQAMGFRTF